MISGVGKHSGSELPKHETDVEFDDHGKRVADWYFRVVTGIYGQDVMIRKFPNKETLALGRRAAVRALKNLTPSQRSRGERLLEQNPGAWPPAAGEFRKLCIGAPEHQILPKALPHKANKETARVWIARMKDNLQ